MPTPETASELLARLRRGDPAAADAVFQRYAERLAALAHARLSRGMARRIDADDVVQSTYRSFFRRAAEGDWHVAANDDLWPLLAAIAMHKLRRQVRRHRAAKRAIARETAASPGLDLEPIEREPTPAEVVAAADELHWLLRQLEPVARQVVELRVAGYTQVEIATQLKLSERTVRRYLAELRLLLEQRALQIETRAARAWDPSSPAVEPRHDSDPVMALVASDFHLEKLIGSGGMCKVYVATRKSDAARVTVKVLRKPWLRRPELVERFVQEARIVARLSHHGIVRVHGLGRLPAGGYFMVMDYVDGEDLARRIARGPVDPRRAAALVANAAEAVQHSHDQGVIHLDIKPANLLLDRQGNVFVTDFGFAALVHAEGAKPGALAGTVGFMAPEMLEAGAAPVSAAADVYGLGAVLRALLARPACVDGDSRPTAGMAIGCVNSRGESLLDITHRCLALEPSERPASARALSLALRSWLEG